MKNLIIYRKKQKVSQKKVFFIKFKNNLKKK